MTTVTSTSGFGQGRRPAVTSSSPAGTRALPWRICPYLIVEGGGWRSGAASRDHRCSAVDPAPPVALEKQRRLCLLPGHAACATFLVATDAHAAGLGAGAAVPATDDVDRERATRWSYRRTTPAILDHTRPALPLPAVASNRRVAQATLGALMAVAVVAVAVARLEQPGTAAPSSLGPLPSAAGRLPSPVASSVTSPAASPTPGPSVQPSSPPTSSSSPPASSAPATPQTYRVLPGDTLGAIARRFGTTVKALAQLNAIADPRTIHVGDVLLIPAPAP